MTDRTLLRAMSKVSFQTKSLIIGGLILLPIFSILITTWISYSTIIDIKEETNEIIYHIHEDRAELLAVAIEESYEQAKMQTECVKYHIVEDVNREYGDDKDKMKEDFKAHNPESPFYQILSKNITAKYINEDNDRNRIFIATRRGILMDNSITYAQYSLKKWENILSGSRNSEFLRESLKHIISQRHKIVLWLDDENDDLNNSDIITDDLDTSINTFLYEKIVSNQLLNLYNYSVATVSYIFDHEDIFGIKDIDAGQVIDNDKLYIIQVFNIRDMVEYNPELKKFLDDYSFLIKARQEKEESIINYRIMATILIIFLQILIFVGVWYLAEFFISKYQKDQG